MPTSEHFFRLRSAPQQRDGERVFVARRRDVANGTPLFRAPSLPTPHQLNRELPFTVNFPPKSPRRT